jgi:hypothetical protein
MLLTTRCVIAFAVLAATATPAYPCLNGTIMEGDEAVKAIVQIEALIDAGNYSQARSGLGDGYHWMDRHLEARASDAEMVIAMRTAPRRVARSAVAYWSARSKQNPKNLKFRAWLAEAYSTVNKREQALAILTDLHKRDVMPDGFAYVTLAKLSDGPEVDAWLDTCRKRAKTKSICTIPTAARRPARTTRSFRMKLPR